MVSKNAAIRSISMITAMVPTCFLSNSMCSKGALSWIISFEHSTIANKKKGLDLSLMTYSKASWYSIMDVTVWLAAMVSLTPSVLLFSLPSSFLPLELPETAEAWSLLMITSSLLIARSSSGSAFAYSVILIYRTTGIVTTSSLIPIFSPHSFGQSIFLTNMSQVSYPRQNFLNCY